MALRVTAYGRRLFCLIMALQVFLCSMGTDVSMARKTGDRTEEITALSLIEHVLSKMMFLGHLPDGDAEGGQDSESGLDSEKEFVTAYAGLQGMMGPEMVFYQFSIRWTSHVPPLNLPPPRGV